MFQIKVVEKIKTHFMFSFFIPTIMPFEMMWKNMVQPYTPQTIQEGAFTLMPVNQGSTQKHTHAQTKCIDIIPIAFPRNIGSTKTPQS